MVLTPPTARFLTNVDVIHSYIFIAERHATSCSIIICFNCGTLVRGWTSIVGNIVLHGSSVICVAAVAAGLVVVGVGAAVAAGLVVADVVAAGAAGLVVGVSAGLTLKWTVEWRTWLELLSLARIQRLMAEGDGLFGTMLTMGKLLMSFVVFCWRWWRHLWVDSGLC